MDSYMKGISMAARQRIAFDDSDPDEDYTQFMSRVKRADEEAAANEAAAKEAKATDELFEDKSEDERPEPFWHPVMDDFIPYGQDAEEQMVNVMDAKIARHPLPEPSDGELYLLKLPDFVGIDPEPFDPKTFKPPTRPHDGSEPTESFNPRTVAANTIRWRRSPKDPNRIESNARIIRWSDGSLTLQLATNPQCQYELPAKPLAAPQRNPKRPTPTSVDTSHSNQSKVENIDSHMYLSSPHESASLLSTVGRFTTSLGVLPPVNADDEAVARLERSFAAASHRGRNGKEGISIISITEDPELAKKKAEVAEREKLRALRRRQAQEERDRDRQNRAMERHGVRTGLTVGNLETDTLGSRSRGLSKPKRKSRRADLDSDEDDGFGRRRYTREDEYDRDDGFLVASDEEEEVVEDEDSEEEISLKEDKRRATIVSPARKGLGQKDKRPNVADRTKRRKMIIDDDDDDDDE